MRTTYAYNSIIFGILLGLLAALQYGTVLGVVVFIVVSVGGFFIIRMFENAVDKGVDAAGKAIKNTYNKHKSR